MPGKTVIRRILGRSAPLEMAGAVAILEIHRTIMAINNGPSNSKQVAAVEERL
jgi:hypothetical protein